MIWSSFPILEKLSTVGAVFTWWMMRVIFAYLLEYIQPSFPFQIISVEPNQFNSGSNYNFSNEEKGISWLIWTGFPANLSIPWFGILVIKILSNLSVLTSSKF